MAIGLRRLGGARKRILVGGGGEAGYRRWRQRRAGRRAVQRAVSGQMGTRTRDMLRSRGRVYTRTRYQGGAAQSGRMIGNRLPGGTPVARGTRTVYTFTARRGDFITRPGWGTDRVVGPGFARTPVPRRTEGTGGTNPSQQAYRASARYRERHGLAAA